MGGREETESDELATNWMADKKAEVGSYVNARRAQHKSSACATEGVRVHKDFKITLLR